MKPCTAHPKPPCLKFWMLHYSACRKGDGEEAVLAGKTDKTGEGMKLLIELYVNSEKSSG